MHDENLMKGKGKFGGHFPYKKQTRQLGKIIMQ